MKRKILTLLAAAGIALLATSCEYGGRTDVGEIACEVGRLGTYVAVSSPNGNRVCSSPSASIDNCFYLFGIDPRLATRSNACQWQGGAAHWYGTWGSL
jgi:hypothetical protein